MQEPVVYSTAPVDRVLTTELGSGLALLELNSNEYFSLDEVGAFVWACFHNPNTVRNAITDVARHYEITEAECAEDVEGLVRDLCNANLLEPANAAVSD